MSELLPDIQDVISEIAHKIDTLESEWKNAHGRAGPKAAELLGRSRLDRLASLARCLAIWFQDAPGKEGDGRLILGWANLGSLVEGMMMFFLSVYHSDYIATGNRTDPDEMWFKGMQHVFVKDIWVGQQVPQWENYVTEIQDARNSIHAYKDRDIKTPQDLERAVRKFNEFISDAVGNLPDPPPAQEDYR